MFSDRDKTTQQFGFSPQSPCQMVPKPLAVSSSGDWQHYMFEPRPIIVHVLCVSSGREIVNHGYRRNVRERVRRFLRLVAEVGRAGLVVRASLRVRDFTLIMSRYKAWSSLMMFIFEPDAGNLSAGIISCQYGAKLM